MDSTGFDEQLAALAEAAPYWRATSLRDRLACVRAFRHLLVERGERLSETLIEEIGKSPEEAYGGDLLPLAGHCRWLERRARRILAPRRLGIWGRPLWMWGYHHVLHRRPWGTVGIIGTWNYPLFLNGNQILSALVAGNVVLWKPSEQTPRCAQELQSLLRDAGFPTGVLQLTGIEREAGQRLLEAPLDYLVFTGSVATGRQIAKRLGERLIPSTLELSGCDALVTLPDADVRQAADTAWFGMTYNRGQTCLAVRRALVPSPLFEPFVARLQELVHSSAPVQLKTARQCEVANDLIEKAQAAGATALRSALPVTDSQFAPTVVVGATSGMEICNAELFAPVLAVIRYDRVDELTRLCRECDYGLETKIFTRTEPIAHEMARRLPVGTVTVNDAMTAVADPRVSLGGRGQSGWGVTQGEEGLRAMTFPQTVSVHKGTWRPHLSQPGEKDYLPAAAIRTMMAALYGRGLFARLRAWLSLPGAMKQSKSDKGE